MKGRALAVVYAVFLGALFARGVPSCTDTTVPPIPPMGYNQQVCLSISSPIPPCIAIPNPAIQSIPVTLELNSTFELRPPGACSANALNNCGHVILYRDGECNNQSASLITDLLLNDVPVAYGKTTITALLVDDCNNPWTLAWDDAGVLGDGGIMCLPVDAGQSTTHPSASACPANAPPAPPSNVTNTCPPNAPLDAAVNIGPYFASVTIDVEPSCPTGAATVGSGGASASTSASTSATGMGGAMTGTGGAMTGTGGAMIGTGGAGQGTGGVAGAGGAGTTGTGGGAGAGTGGAGPSDAGDGG